MYSLPPLPLSFHPDELLLVRPAYRQILSYFDRKDGDQGGVDRPMTDDRIPCILHCRELRARGNPVFELGFPISIGREFVKLLNGAIRTGSLNFCMVPFEAGKLQFNGTPSFGSASKPFFRGLFR